MTFRRFAALVGVTVALAATAGCSGRSAAHKAEHEIFNAIEFADVESVVSTKDLADEVEYVFHATPSFEVTESITPPDGWRFEEAFDRRESFEGDAQLFYFGCHGPSADYSDCYFKVVTRPGDSLVEVHVNCVFTG